MARQKACLVQEPGDSIHLNEMLDVDFLLKAQLSDFKLLMAVYASFARGSAARGQAAAKALEVGDRSVEKVAGVEVLLFLDLGSERVFGRNFSGSIIVGLF